MLLKIVYLLVRRILGLAVLLFRREMTKDAELLVLRHENAVLRRHAHRVRRDLRCCGVAAPAADPDPIDPMGGGGGDHQAATERHLRPVRQAPRGPAPCVPVQLKTAGDGQARAGARRCSRCGKPYGGRNGNPLTHVCRQKTDFKSRRAKFNRKVRTRAAQSQRKARADRERERRQAAVERERQRGRARAAKLKAAYEARLRAAKARAKAPAATPHKPARPRRPPHEYQSCRDKDCMRPVCVAFKEGYRDGHRDGYREGFEQGWKQGYAKGYAKGYADGFGAGYSTGFAAGLASCPGPHGG